jgi:hypothetical protein
LPTLPRQLCRAWPPRFPPVPRQRRRREGPRPQLLE